MLITIKPILCTDTEKFPFNIANAKTAIKSHVSSTAITTDKNSLPARIIQFLYETPTIGYTQKAFLQSMRMESSLEQQPSLRTDHLSDIQQTKKQLTTGISLIVAR